MHAVIAPPFRRFLIGMATAALLAALLPAAPETLATKGKDDHPSLDLAITQIVQAENGDLALVAKCSFEGAPAGIELVIGHSWRKMATAGMYLGEARIVGRGSESQVFLTALAATLGEKPPAGALAETKLAAILTGNPSSISTTPAWIQLVYGNAASPDYAELYVYTDIKGRRLRLKESDPRLRDALLKLFASSPPPAKPAKAPPEIDVDRATLADFQRVMPDHPELAAYEYRLQKKIDQAFFEEMKEWHFSGGGAPGSLHSFSLMVLVLSDGRLGADADDLKRVTRDEPILATVATRAIGRITDHPEPFSAALKTEIGPSFRFQARFWQR